MTDDQPTQPYEPQPSVPGSPEPASQPAPAQPVEAPAQPTSAQPAEVQAPPAPAVPAAAAPVPEEVPTSPVDAPAPPPPWLPGESAQAPAAPPPVWTPPPAAAGAAPPGGMDVPAAPVAGKRRGGGPLRWIVALLVVALVVAGGLGATLLLTSSTAATSAVLAYTPADTLTYAEARLDLPGNQHAELAKTLSAFPGFADQAALDAKLGELFDRIIRAGTNGKHDYQTEIAPWFGGQLAIAPGPTAVHLGAGRSGATPAPSQTADPVAALPPCTGGDSPAAAPSDDLVVGGMSVSVRVLGLASVTDTQKAEAWVGSVLAEGGSAVKTTDRTCDGVVVHVIAPSGSSAVGAPEFGWAIVGGKVLVGGDLDSIRLAIATKGTGGLNTNATFQKAIASLPGDHLGFVYEALRASLQAQMASAAALDTDGTLTALYDVLVGMTPEWIAGDLKAADGDFVVDSAQPAGDLATSTNRASDLAALAPPDTIALVDVHDVGKTLENLRSKLASNPKLQTYVQQFDEAVGLAGGFNGTVGWIGDAGFAVTSSGSGIAGISGGILIRPDDAGAATQLFTQLRSLAALAGGSGVAITDETYNGATITTVDLSALAPMLESGSGLSVLGMPLPSTIKFSYVITDKVVVFTLDPAFAKAVIDASQGGDSLAKDPRFSALLNKAGAQNTGLMWLDITATRQLVEGVMPADARAAYEADIQPYLIPIDALMSVGVSDAGLQRGKAILSIKH